jgi:hypothetical protein
MLGKPYRSIIRLQISDEFCLAFSEALHNALPFLNQATMPQETKSGARRD